MTEALPKDPTPEQTVEIVRASEVSSAALERDVAYWMTQAQIASQRLDHYDDATWQLVRRTYAPSLNDDEFVLFVHHARRQGLDPLQRQIYAYAANGKRGRELVIIAGYHGLLARCYRVPTFLGIQGAPVYSAEAGDRSLYWVDEVAGTVRHEHGMSDRGVLVGAWARGQHRGKVPMVKEALLRHYQKTGDAGQFWSSIPDHMITKVVKGQLARELVPEDTAGTYVAEEFGGVSLPDGRVVMPAALPEGKVSGPKAARPKSAAEKAASDHVDALEQASTPEQLAKVKAAIGKVWGTLPTGAQLLIKSAGERANARLGVTDAPKTQKAEPTPPPPPTDDEPPDGQAVIFPEEKGGKAR